MRALLFAMAVGASLYGSFRPGPCASCMALLPGEICTVGVIGQTPGKIEGRMAALSDFGAEDLAFLALPREQPIGGVVILHDRWGLNKQVKATANTLAELGYIAIAPDLFNGKQAKDVNEAEALRQNVRPASAYKTIEAAVKLLRQSPRFKVQKIAFFGFGVGAGLGLQDLDRLKDIDAMVAFYPSGGLTPEEAAKMHTPLCAIIANQDAEVPLQLVSDYQRVVQRGPDPAEFHFFEAKHGFADPNNREYSRAQYGEAWNFALDFLHREMIKPPKPQPALEPLLDKVTNLFKKDSP